jgi:hypothetical protein
MSGDNGKPPDHKPSSPHDRVIVLATLGLGALLVTIGHLNAEGVVAVLGALGVFYRGFRD